MTCVLCGPDMSWDWPPRAWTAPPNGLEWATRWPGLAPSGTPQVTDLNCPGPKAGAGQGLRRMWAPKDRKWADGTLCCAPPNIYYLLCNI